MNQRAICSTCDEKWSWQEEQTVAGFCKYNVSLRQAPQQPGISEGWALCEQKKRRRAVDIGFGSLLASGSDVCTYFLALCPGQRPGGHSQCGPVLCG